MYINNENLVFPRPIPKPSIIRCIYLGSDKKRLSEAGDAFYVERELLKDSDCVKSFVHFEG